MPTRCGTSRITPAEASGTAVKGSLHSWDLSTGVDGPGTRFVAFLAGCPLRCVYCQNPDTWRMRDGRSVTVDELMDEAGKYVRFISLAGGGVTASGGEPLLQPAFVTAFFRRCRELGLHTALDTSGVLGRRAGDDLLDLTDLVLLDLKSWDRATYRAVTGGEVTPTLVFARRLAERRVPTWIRFVLVPGLTDEPANVEGIASFAASLRNVSRVDVLPLHRLGEAKYAALGLPFPLAEVEPPSAELLDRVRDQFRSHGLLVA